MKRKKRGGESKNKRYLANPLVVAGHLPPHDAEVTLTQHKSDHSSKSTPEVNRGRNREGKVRKGIKKMRNGRKTVSPEDCSQKASKPRATSSGFDHRIRILPPSFDSSPEAFSAHPPQAVPWKAAARKVSLSEMTKKDKEGALQSRRQVSFFCFKSSEVGLGKGLGVSTRQLFSCCKVWLFY